MLTATSATHCNGYVHGAATNPTALNIAATVTADTGDGIKLQTAKGAICIGTDVNATISDLKPLSIK